MLFKLCPDIHFSFFYQDFLELAVLYVRFVMSGFIVMDEQRKGPGMEPQIEMTAKLGLPP